MRDAQPRTIFLKDYRPPDYLIEHTDLHFDLFDEYTTVTSQLTYRLNESGDATAPLILHGSELDLEYLAINGVEVEESRFSIRDEVLELFAVPERGRIETRVRIKPQDNTSLEGLYRSRGLFCTQCEAEGFRKITWFPDRPDVMSIYRVTIDASASDCPELLSNGNLVHQQALADGRHRAVWEDPFPKPSYLFALVAGKLSRVEDEFETMNGRRVRLVILVEEKDLDKCAHAMDSLKRSMRWDEERFGREYDLDVFHIVAVDDFNMGAMENKSLNVFNTSCVLASPATTTDQGYQRVEAIVAHEYFHNWSGNRVTCRDWFQLSLKEGFTVFRDAEFSSDMGSRALKRVEDAGVMRTMQFAEDAGPMAHPIRPDSFIEISNFYTLTVYEKGAEVVRMYHTLLGEELFRKGSDLYFDRHDGQAVTCDDFVAAMEDASGMDFSHFKLWYSQAGTPELTVSGQWDEGAQTYTLDFKQQTPPTPGQSTKQPLLIPLAMGLLGADGNLPLTLVDGEKARVTDDQLEAVLMIDQESQRFQFEGVSEQPIPSLLRGFSAPIRVEHAYSREELAALASRDADGFVRWDAMQQLLVSALDELQSLPIADKPEGATQAESQSESRGDALAASRIAAGWELDASLAQAFTRVAEDRLQDPAIRAETLRLPSESYLTELASHRGGAHPHRIRESREALRSALASALTTTWEALYSEHHLSGPYAATGEQIGHRSLANLSLAYFATAQVQGVNLAMEQYRNADNLTDRLAALRIVLHEGSDEQAAELLADFYERFGGEALALNHWFQVQAERTQGDSISRVHALMEHPAYDRSNPNKIRALVGGFANLNTAGFHREDGAGYRLLGGVIEELNERNPQIASRLLTPLTRWRFYPALGDKMRTELERLAALPSLSRDVYEVVSKSLAG